MMLQAASARNIFSSSKNFLQKETQSIKLENYETASLNARIAKKEQNVDIDDFQNSVKEAIHKTQEQILSASGSQINLLKPSGLGKKSLLQKTEKMSLPNLKIGQNVKNNEFWALNADERRKKLEEQFMRNQQNEQKDQDERQ